MFDKCVTCHRPDEVGPFSLLTYQDTKKRGKMIQLVTEKRTMPPWHPAEGHGEFRNVMRLSDDQLATIKRWVETGMAEGDVKLQPKAPEFESGWSLGKPDLVVSMEKAYSVPAVGRDIYANFTIPVNLPEDKWVTAVDLKASAKSVVHHVLMFAASANAKGGKGGAGGGAGGIGGLRIDEGHRQAARRDGQVPRLHPPLGLQLAEHVSVQGIGQAAQGYRDRCRADLQQLVREPGQPLQSAEAH